MIKEKGVKGHVSAGNFITVFLAKSQATRISLSGVFVGGIPNWNTTLRSSLDVKFSGYWGSFSLSLVIYHWPAPMLLRVYMPLVKLRVNPLVLLLVLLPLASSPLTDLRAFISMGSSCACIALLYRSSSLVYLAVWIWKQCLLVISSASTLTLDNLMSLVRLFILNMVLPDWVLSMSHTHSYQPPTAVVPGFLSGGIPRAIIYNISSLRSKSTSEYFFNLELQKFS